MFEIHQAFCPPFFTPLSQQQIFDAFEGDDYIKTVVKVTVSAASPHLPVGKHEALVYVWYACVCINLCICASALMVLSFSLPFSHFFSPFHVCYFLRNLSSYRMPPTGTCDLIANPPSLPLLPRPSLPHTGKPCQGTLSWRTGAMIIHFCRT